jgi:GntR family transcriptional regulator, vanillate catabolism transcriptional regulator
MNDPILHTDLSQKVYETLRAKILNGELKPGEKLTQQKIAEYLAVSRMPLHRAFQMLEADLLVEQKPRRGFYVREFEVSEIVDAFEIRELLEGLAVRKLAEHAAHKNIAQKLHKAFEPFINASEINSEEYRKNDRMFHLQIMEMTDNVILQKLNKIGHFLLHSFKPGLVRTPEETLPEHLEIIDCIREGNGAGAEKAMTNHIKKSLKVFRKTYQ